MANRLTRDVLEKKGRYTKHYAEALFTDYEAGAARRLRGHRLSVTCVALSSDNSTCFSGGKDCCVLSWDVETGRKKASLVDSEMKQVRAPPNPPITAAPMTVPASN